MIKNVKVARLVISGLIVSLGIGIFLLALLLSPPLGQAGAAPSATTYAVTWYTADNGGGISTGGGYEIAGTIGQMDATSGMESPDYGVGGGFWAAFIDQLYKIFLPTTMK